MGRMRVGKKGQLAVFVAMSFRWIEEPALIDYFEAIKRAARRVRRRPAIEMMEFVGGDREIPQAIMERISSCDLLIADFTLSSPNVFFEVGFARGRDKRIIQMAREGTELPFDVRNWPTLFYRNATELEAKLAAALAGAIA